VSVWEYGSGSNYYGVLSGTCVRRPDRGIGLLTSAVIPILPLTHPFIISALNILKALSALAASIPFAKLIS